MAGCAADGHQLTASTRMDGLIFARHFSQVPIKGGIHGRRIKGAANGARCEFHSVRNLAIVSGVWLLLITGTMSRLSSKPHDHDRLVPD